MSALQPSDLTIDRALKIVKSYDRAQITNTKSQIEPEELRNSLLLIIKLSPSQNLGICADNFQQGIAALASYLEAFGYQHDSSLSRHQSDWEQENAATDSERTTRSPEPSSGVASSPVYLKFNTQKMSYYSKKYTGEHRGVLVSCQSENDLIAGTYGHFPLDLFLDSKN